MNQVITFFGLLGAVIMGFVAYENYRVLRNFERRGEAAFAMFQLNEAIEKSLRWLVYSSVFFGASTLATMFFKQQGMILPGQVFRVGAILLFTAYLYFHTRLLISTEPRGPE